MRPILLVAMLGVLAGCSQRKTEEGEPIESRIEAAVNEAVAAAAAAKEKEHKQSVESYTRKLAIAEGTIQTLQRGLTIAEARIQTLEQELEQELGIAKESIREEYAWVKRQFGMLDSQKQRFAIALKLQLDAGETLSLEHLDFLHNVGGWKVREAVDREYDKRADAAGFGTAFTPANF
ncbi:MAG TPA: hypothetical protein VMY37_25255 [Thermoguttaceae bacterium]|nr:hypothetical protein [Thermoguttaceae bacterium]